jgi:hypothetical protein
MVEYSIKNKMYIGLMHIPMNIYGFENENENENDECYCRYCGNRDGSFRVSNYLGNSILCIKCNMVLNQKELLKITCKILGVKKCYWSGCNGCGNKKAYFSTASDGNNTIMCYFCNHVLYKNGRIFN